MPETFFYCFSVSILLQNLMSDLQARLATGQKQKILAQF